MYVEQYVAQWCIYTVNKYFLFRIWKNNVYISFYHIHELLIL